MDTIKFQHGISNILSPDFPLDVNLLTPVIGEYNIDSASTLSGSRDSRFSRADESDISGNEDYTDFWNLHNFDPDEILFTNPLTWIHFGITEAFFKKVYPVAYEIVDKEYWVLAGAMFNELSSHFTKQKVFKFSFSGRETRVYAKGAMYSLLISYCYSTCFISGLSSALGKEGRLDDSLATLIRRIEDKGFDDLKENPFDERDLFPTDSEGEYDFNEMFPYRILDMVAKHREGELVFYSCPMEAMYTKVREQYHYGNFEVEELKGRNATGYVLQPKFSAVSTFNLPFWINQAVEEYRRYGTPRVGIASEDVAKHNKAKTFEERMAALRLSEVWINQDTKELQDFSRTAIENSKEFELKLKAIYAALAKKEEGLKVEVNLNFKEDFVCIADLCAVRTLPNNWFEIAPLVTTGKGAAKSGLVLSFLAEMNDLKQEDDSLYTKFIKSLEIRPEVEVREEIERGRASAMRSCIFTVEAGRAERLAKDSRTMKVLGFTAHNVSMFKEGKYLSQNMLYAVISREKGSETLTKVKKVIYKFRRKDYSIKQAGDIVLSLIS